MTGGVLAAWLRRPVPSVNEAICLAARTTLSDAARGRLAQLTADGPLEWAEVESLASKHRVGPLVARHADAGQLGPCPPDVLTRFRDSSRVTATRNLRLVGVLIGLARALRGADVPFLALKGPSAAVAHYGNLGLRQFSDLDLLVPPRHALAAWDVVAGRGYTPQYDFRGRWRVAFQRHAYEATFRGASPPVSVDLHWELIPRGYSFGLGERDVWDRPESIVLGGVTVPTLSSEAALLFACVHGVKHEWDHLRLVADVAEILRSRPGLDWDRMLRWCRAPGRGGMVALGLTLARRLLEAPVPPAAAAAIARPGVESLARSIADGLLSRPGGAFRFTARPWRGVFFAAMRSPRDRARFAYQTLFEPTPLEWHSIRLPAWTAEAFHILRPLRLAEKYARTFVHRRRY